MSQFSINDRTQFPLAGSWGRQPRVTLDNCKNSVRMWISWWGAAAGAGWCWCCPPPAPATFLAVIVCCESRHGHRHQPAPASNILTPKFQGDWREDSRHQDTAELLHCSLFTGDKNLWRGGGVLGGGGDSKWLISISLWSLEDNDVLAAGTPSLDAVVTLFWQRTGNKVSK